uniref:GM01352p n=1 Tax=Drosophila melanogaster TaxID=7227 RepID=Q95SE7_DROME|nr:GM01352p [Drosophila melanogaster]
MEIVCNQPHSFTCTHLELRSNLQNVVNVSRSFGLAQILFVFDSILNSNCTNCERVRLFPYAYAIQSAVCLFGLFRSKNVFVVLFCVFLSQPFVVYMRSYVFIYVLTKQLK